MKTLKYPLIHSAVLALVLSSPIISYAGSTLDDNLIVTTIKLKQTADPLLNPFKITVTSHNGVVKLRGEVKSKVQFERALAQAAAIENVTDVDVSDLKIKASDKPLTDTIITAKIKGKLLQSKLFDNIDLDALGVKVETKNQQVFLAGEVDNDDDRRTIIQIARTVSNVKSVNATGLTIKRS